jgi:hypothetical protein
LGLSPATNALSAAGIELGAREAAAVLNASRANLAAVQALKERVAKDLETVQTQAVNQYITASTSAHSGPGVITVSGNLAVVQVCTTETVSGNTYDSVGPGVGIPGLTMTAGNVTGKSADAAQTGWSSCVEVAVFIGGQQCWTNAGSGSTKSFEESSGPGAGVWIMYGRKMGS